MPMPEGASLNIENIINSIWSDDNPSDHRAIINAKNSLIVSTVKSLRPPRRQKLKSKRKKIRRDSVRKTLGLARNSRPSTRG